MGRVGQASIGLVALAALLLGQGRALAGAPEASEGATQEGKPLERWYQRTESVVNEIVERYRIVPPQKRKLDWRARRLGRVELGEELLQIQTMDVDGDGRDELFLLSESALWRVGSAPFAVLHRHELRAEEAQIRPRWPMGSIHGRKDERGPELVLRSSRKATASRVRPSLSGEAWSEEPFVDAGGGVVSGYPLCEGVRVDSVLGRSELSSQTLRGAPAIEEKGPLSAASCGTFVASTGRKANYLATLGAGDVLELVCWGNDAECWAGKRQFEGAGYAHHVSDLDTDGHPEIIMASVSAKGGRDRVVVLSHTGSELRRLFDRSFASGILAIGSGDLDGDGGDSVVLAHRGTKAGEVELWLLN